MYDYRHLTAEERAELVRTRLSRGYPPHEPPHSVRDRTLYLFTASCYNHQRLIDSPERRRELLDAVFDHFLSMGMEITAWVILPNHYHLVADAVDMAKIGSIFKAIHGASARLWNLADQQVGRKVWYRYSDRAIRSERHYFTTLNYLHFNPVKHGWAASPYDWPHSSIHWYLQHMGRDWLRDLWIRYPVRDYGRGWDDILNIFPDS